MHEPTSSSGASRLTRIYPDYQRARARVFEHLRGANPTHGTPELIAATRCVLDCWMIARHVEEAGLAPAGLASRGANPRAAANGGEAWAAMLDQVAAVLGEGWNERARELELASVEVPNCGLWDPGPDGLRARLGSALTLTELSGVFERSITDLERWTAALEGRDLDRSPGRRKHDGVYFSPPWLSAYLVRETVGVWLDGQRRELGLGLEREGPASLAALAEWGRRLAAVTVLDPACGAGSCLLAAFDLLLDHRREHAQELARASSSSARAAHEHEFDAGAAAAAILQHNLHGVDVDPRAVEFTRLTLSLRAAACGRAPGHPPPNIRRGNALIDDDSFAWARSFPDRFPGLAHGPDPRSDHGFDCVVGNPPYVKLQHFRRRPEQRADALIQARTSTGEPRYESAQTGNFDLSLPFIERGVWLLREAGRLGFIAPSAWINSEYGEGLRGFVRRTRCLERWVDFGDYQVFADATTYTAVQLFTARPCAQLRHVVAARGPLDLAQIDWRSGDGPAVIPYELLPSVGAWQFMAAEALALCAELRAGASTLAEACAGISVGVQTSADAIFQVRRVGPGRYRVGTGPEARELALEDGILRPLLTGADANRYQEPTTDTHLLFPYDTSGPRPALIPAAELAARFPRAWAYLGEHEQVLRQRERGKMDRDDRWWGYNYPKNLSKQHLPKLVVAQTVPSLRVAHDHQGRHCLDNVRVNAVFAESPDHAWFLLAVLNGPVADFVFRATAKRKAGGYFEANKQYIAPLPVPVADAEQRRTLGAGARRLQALHTRRAAGIAAFDELLGRHARDPGRRYADVVELAGDPATLAARLRPRARLVVADDLSVSIDGTLALRWTGPRSAFVAARWRQAIRKLVLTEALDATRLVRGLGRLRDCEDREVVERLLALDRELVELDATIFMIEAEIDECIYRLHGLGPAQIRLIRRFGGREPA